MYLDSNKYTVFRWPSERAIVDERFAYQKKRQDYQRVLASTQVVGVWDGALRHQCVLTSLDSVLIPFFCAQITT